MRLVDPGLNVSLDGATVSFHRVDGIVQIVIVVFFGGSGMATEAQTH